MKEKRVHAVIVWSADSIDTMLTMVRDSIGRPHAFALKNNRVNDILRAAKAAGREIVETGAISSVLQDAVSREILPRDEYMALINKTAVKYLE